MTSELLNTINSMFEARVPDTWAFTPGGDKFSWISPTFGLWFASLVQRDAQQRAWLNHGRPLGYWLAGFKNPTGFLTAMKQEVTRLHKADEWALDDVVYRNHVEQYDGVEQLKVAAKEGVYIYGLFVEGAAWSKHDESLVESEPKKMFTSLPVLLVTGTTQAQKASLIRSMALGPHGPFESPCYKYPSRTGRYFIFMVDLPTKATAEGDAKLPQHWILRGVATLCSSE